MPGVDTDGNNVFDDTDNCLGMTNVEGNEADNEAVLRRGMPGVDTDGRNVFDDTDNCLGMTNVEGNEAETRRF